MKKVLFIALFLLFINGCSMTVEMPPDDHQRIFIYKYKNQNEQGENWLLARNYFAKNYVNINEILHVQDERNGYLIGQALVKWPVTDMSSASCGNYYTIKFHSKYGFAKLTLELLERNSYGCNWPTPSKYGYDQVVTEFNSIGTSLEAALQNKAY